MKSFIKLISVIISVQFPVLFRGSLYFSAVFLAVMGEKLSPFADKDLWPTPIKWLAMLTVAVGGGIVAVRAYFDGSALRHSDKIEKQNGNAYDTSFLKRATEQQQTPTPTKQT